MSNIVDSLGVSGWVPAGSYQGNNILALWKDRFLYNPKTGEGCFLHNFSSSVPPRNFICADKIKGFFDEMVESIKKYHTTPTVSNVPPLLSIPLVTDWDKVLDVDEKRLETTEMDKRTRATFKMMPEELRYVIWKAFAFDSKHSKDYYFGQRKWLEDSNYFLGRNLGHEPSNEECIECYFTKGISLEFRINFALKNPDLMDLVSDRIDLTSANIREPYQLPFAA